MITNSRTPQGVCGLKFDICNRHTKSLSRTPQGVCGLKFLNKVVVLK